MDAEPFDEQVIAAEVLGRECRTYLAKSEAISARVMQVLNDNLEDAPTSAIALIWARKADTEIEYAFALLRAFYVGITHHYIQQ